MTNSKPLLSYQARSLIDESSWPQAEKLLSKTTANEPTGRMPNGRLVTINISPSIVPFPIYSSSSSRLPTPLPHSSADYTPEGKQKEVVANPIPSSASSSSSSSSRLPTPLPHSSADYTPEGKQKEIVANPIPSSASSSSSSSSRSAENAGESAPLSSTTFRVHDSLSSLAQLRELGLRLRELQSHAQQTIYNCKHGYKFSVGEEAQEFRLCLIKAGIDCSQVKNFVNQWMVTMDSAALSRLLNSSYTYSFSDVYEARHMIHQLRAGQIEYSSKVEDVNGQFVWKISLTKEGGHRLMDHPPLQMDSVRERITPETQRLIQLQLQPGSYNVYECLPTTFAIGAIWGGVCAAALNLGSLAFGMMERTSTMTKQQAKTAAKGGAIGVAAITGGVLICRVAHSHYRHRRRAEARYAAEI